MSSHLSRIAAFAAAFVCFALVPRGSRASWEERLNTVHFYQIQDYGTPIRRTQKGSWDVNLWDANSGGTSANGKRSGDHSYAAANSARLVDWYGDYAYSGEEAPTVESLYATAFMQAQTGMWTEARSTYKAAAKLARHWTGDLRDTVDLLATIIASRHLTTAGRNAVQLYFRAIEAGRQDKWDHCKSLLTELSSGPGSKFLADRISYQSACISYEIHDRNEAVKLYKVCADRYPDSPKREESLVMIARICILQDTPDQKTLATGQAAIRQLLSSYPHTRFYKSAIGLRARIHFLKHEFSDALWCYYRLGDLDSVRIVCDSMPREAAKLESLRLLEAYVHLIGDAGNDDGEDIFTVRQINRLRSLMSLEMLNRLRNDLENSPSLLASYIYYRLYYTNTRLQDLASLAKLARTDITRNPNGRISAAVAVRLAEVEYQQADYPQSIEWASRALSSNKMYSRALFMRGSAEAKLHQLEFAQRDLQSVLETSHDHPIRQSARELLALTCEQSGKLDLALEQYFQLGFDLDVAYLLDVRMSAKQIETYYAHCSTEKVSKVLEYRNQPGKPVTAVYTRKQLLAYTLGIRYMRQEMWSKASKWLLTVPKQLRYQFDTGRRDFGSNPSPDALDAVKDLSLLQAKTKRAGGYETKAAAAYRYASYYHTHGALLLYNAMLWDGERVRMFEMNWNTMLLTNEDPDGMKNYLAGHEVYLRSRKLCLDIVKRYPHSRVASQALYRAACASERSSALASWYEGQNHGFLYAPAGEPSALMRRLVSLYPHSPLVASATKYAGVFAANSRPAGWPKYAVAGHTKGPRPNSLRTANDAEITDAEALLAAVP